MQRHELEAWLGDDHLLTGEQINELLATASDIEARYPNEDEREEREAALQAAHYLVINGSAIVVNTLKDRLTKARTAELRALAGLQQAALSVVHKGGRGVESEQGFAEAAGLDRMTVRKWLGKR